MKMLNKILIVLFLIMLCIPSYSMTYDEYKARVIKQQAWEWQQRVANSPKVNGRFYNHYSKSKIRGIGIKLEAINGQLTITDVKKNSRADREGLRKGEIITKINQYNISNTDDAGFWGSIIDVTPNGIPIIEIEGGIQYSIYLEGVENIDYKEIAPKVYIDIASINIKKGAMFFWLKYYNGNELIPINDKKISYYEGAYVIDFINNKYAMIERSAFDYNDNIIWRTANAKNANIATKTGWTSEILGYNPNADYSGLEYSYIKSNTAAAFLKQVALSIMEKAKHYKNIRIFLDTLRYY